MRHAAVSPQARPTNSNSPPAPQPQQAPAAPAPHAAQTFLRGAAGGGVDAMDVVEALRLAKAQYMCAKDA
jgi:hypothetical protein